MTDSSDEEWEEEFWRPAPGNRVDMDAQVDTREMVHDAFECRDDPTDLEYRIREEVLQAFTTADDLHEECSQGQSSSGDDDGVPADIGERAGDTNPMADTIDKKFDAEILEEALFELYPGAHSTKLAATILIMNLCTIHGVSNTFANELFAILHAYLLPQENSLPKNYHGTKSLTMKLGLSYYSIHACQKGCVLFRGEHADALCCPKCEQPRYRDLESKIFPVKVLRHFPIIPRLQRMFRSPAISKLMLWHSENSSHAEGGDNLVRHPCDSKAWRHFHENVDPEFGNDPRNAHFALAADGVNPFAQTRSTWSTWPMTLLNYNLPPWLCTKQFFVILALLIPGKQSVTSEVFDVYLQPLVEEFLELWRGIPAYDIAKDVGSRSFTLRALLLWTIHDFPGYGTVGGFAHKRYTACPWCGPDLGVEHSVELGKQTYGGTRRWLPEQHAYRGVHMQGHFNGEAESRAKPRVVSV
jgi:hypothetical protein